MKFQKSPQQVPSDKKNEAQGMLGSHIPFYVKTAI